MAKKKDIWVHISKNLKSTLSTSEFNTWISTATLRNLDKDLAVIDVPNRFVASWLRENYLTQIQDSFKANLDFVPEILFAYPPTRSAQPLKKYESTPNFSLHPPHKLNPDLTFDTFITDQGNRFAYSSALDVTMKLSPDYNPLYIFSQLSVGKTHLLNAIANRITATNPSVKLKYVPADSFSSHFLKAKRERKLPKFRELYKNLDFFLLDDIHRLASSERSQHELISLFDSLYESGNQIVITASHPPRQIENLTPKLTSRLEWGLLLEIKGPDEETKMKIIRQKAIEKNLDMPDDIAFFLINNSTDLKGLLEYICILQEYASLSPRPIDMSIVKHITRRTEARKISIEQIKGAVVAHFNISPSDLLSHEKKHRFSYARHIAMYLCRELTNLSLKNIANAFGNKDHSTVLYGIRRIKKYIDEQHSTVLDDLKYLRKSIF